MESADKDRLCDKEEKLLDVLQKVEIEQTIGNAYENESEISRSDFKLRNSKGLKRVGGNEDESESESESKVPVPLKNPLRVQADRLRAGKWKMENGKYMRLLRYVMLREEILEWKWKDRYGSGYRETVEKEIEEMRKKEWSLARFELLREQRNGWPRLRPTTAGLMKGCWAEEPGAGVSLPPFLGLLGERKEDALVRLMIIQEYYYLSRARNEFQRDERRVHILKEAMETSPFVAQVLLSCLPRGAPLGPLGPGGARQFVGRGLDGPVVAGETTHAALGMAGRRFRALAQQHLRFAAGLGRAA